MFYCNKKIYSVSFCTMLFVVYANSLQYALRRVHLPCSHRRPLHPLLLQQLALKKYYEDLMREKLNLGNPVAKLEVAEPTPVNAESQAEIKPAPTNDEEDSNKALMCAKLLCSADELGSAVCACNHVTGRVATFKDACDLKRHNCRYDTVFKVILPEICPWEYQFRRNSGKPLIDYSDPKYYN